MRFIIFPGTLAEGAAQLPELGPKAGYLADVAMALPDLAVPPWFVVRPSAFDASLDPAMARQLMGPAPDWDAFEALRPGDDVLRELADAWRVLGSPPVLAVRASAAMPIAGGGSDFMGVFDSFCPVLPAVLPDRVADVWRSAFTDDALAWRHRQQQSGVQIPAVMVQARINARFCGGVMTADPRDGSRAAFLVSGIAGSTDQWQYEQHQGSPVFARLLRDQPIAGDQVLSSAQYMAIVAMARRIETHFSRPVDLDWAIDAENRLYLLQVRMMCGTAAAPILSIAPETPPPDSAVSTPEPELPVTWWQNITDDLPLGWRDVSGLYAARLNAGWQVLMPDGQPLFADIGGRLCLDRGRFFAGPHWPGGALPATHIVPPPGYAPPAARTGASWGKIWAARQRVRKMIAQSLVQGRLHLEAATDPALRADPDPDHTALALERLIALAPVAAVLPYGLLFWPDADWARAAARLEHRYLASLAGLVRQGAGNRPQMTPPPRGPFRQQGDDRVAEAWWPQDHHAPTFLAQIMRLVAAAIDG